MVKPETGTIAAVAMLFSGCSMIPGIPALTPAAPSTAPPGNSAPASTGTSGEPPSRAPSAAANATTGKAAAGSASCGPDIAAIRGMTKDAQILVQSSHCIAGNTWAVTLVRYSDGKKNDAYVVSQRLGDSWQLVTTADHGGDCFTVLDQPGAPVRELFGLMGGLCAYAAGAVDVVGQPVTTAGVGPLRVGMSAKKAIDSGYVEEGSSGCPGTHDASPALQHLGIYALVEDRRSEVTALQFNDQRWRTPSGARVGTAESELKRLYPNLKMIIDRSSALPVYYVISGDQRLGFVMEDARVARMNVDRSSYPFDGEC